MVKLHVEQHNAKYCCFSSDGRLIAAVSGTTAYVWDIACPEPHLIETFVGHSDDICALEFSSPSSLISLWDDKSVKFWKIGTSLMDPVEIDSESAAYCLTQAKSITLQAKESIIVISNSTGVVRIWDILTDHQKRSFQIPFNKSKRRDVHLIDDRLIAVWDKSENIHIWDTKKQKSLEIAIQECYKNSALFTQFLLSFLTYVLLSYFVHLHCTNIHILLPSFSFLMTSQTSNEALDQTRQYMALL